MWELVPLLIATLLLIQEAPEARSIGAVAEPAVCEIRARQTDDRFHLSAVLLSSEALAGTYRFEVEARGSGTSSNSLQSGTFMAAAEEHVLARAAISAGRGASYWAELTISWPEGEAACSWQGP